MNKKFYLVISKQTGGRLSKAWTAQEAESFLVRESRRFTVIGPFDSRGEAEWHGKAPAGIEYDETTSFLLI